MVTVDSPASLNRANIPEIAVTIATRPKSFGSRSRARIIRDPTRRTRLAPWEETLARPPRTTLPLRLSIAHFHVAGRQLDARGNARPRQLFSGTGGRTRRRQKAKSRVRRPRRKITAAF